MANKYNVQRYVLCFPFPYHLILETQTLEQSAQNCTSVHVGQFLQEIGLSHHVAAFIEQDISGDVLLEPDQEMLKELGVSSAVVRKKIKTKYKTFVKSQQ